jgi:hypothetical protein
MASYAHDRDWGWWPWQWKCECSGGDGTGLGICFVLLFGLVYGVYVAVLWIISLFRPLTQSERDSKKQGSQELWKAARNAR